MSFIIKSNASSAFAARGLQEWHAHDRRAEHRPNPAARHQGPLADSCDLTQSGQTAAAIREARDFQARLNESLSFLQTQDCALVQIESLFASASERQDFVEMFESLTGEKFNGLDLFTHDGAEQPIFIQAPASEDSVCIHRPLLSAESPLTSLQEAVHAAREENQKEQAKLREISVSTDKLAPCPLTGVEKISTPDSAKATITCSQRFVLSDAATALSGQANAAHSSVLRLFS